MMSDSGEIELKIAPKNETLWLNQKQIVDALGCAGGLVRLRLLYCVYV
jgi:hypothetical protein